MVAPISPVPLQCWARVVSALSTADIARHRSHIISNGGDAWRERRGGIDGNGMVWRLAAGVAIHRLRDSVVPRSCRPPARAGDGVAPSSGARISRDGDQQGFRFGRYVHQLRLLPRLVRLAACRHWWFSVCNDANSRGRSRQRFQEWVE